MVKMILNNFHAYFFSHGLHSHNIQHFVMTLNTFFSFYLFYFSPWKAVTTHSDLFSSTWADWGLEFFHISLGPKIRQLTCCTAVRVLKSSVFINTTRVFLIIYSKIQIIEKSLCIFVYIWWICAHTWKKDSNLQAVTTLLHPLSSDLCLFLLNKKLTRRSCEFIYFWAIWKWKI